MPSYEMSPKILKLFPEFDGESELLDDYIDKFNRILNAFSLNKVMAFRILKLKVTGRALRALKTAEKERSVYDYQSLITELGKILETNGSRIKAKYGLAVEMKEDESLEAFAEKIRKYVKIAYPNFSAEHQESLMSDYFVKGIKREFREKLMSKTYPTLEDALSKAERENDKREMRGLDSLERKIEALTDLLKNSNKVQFLNETSRRETPASGAIRNYDVSASELERKIDKLSNILKNSTESQQINFMNQSGYDEDYSNEDGEYSFEYEDRDELDDESFMKKQDSLDWQHMGYDERSDHHSHRYRSGGYDDNESYDNQYNGDYQDYGVNHSFQDDSHDRENYHHSLNDEWDHEYPPYGTDSPYCDEHVQEGDTYHSDCDAYSNDYDEQPCDGENCNESLRYYSNNSGAHSDPRNYVHYVEKYQQESSENENIDCQETSEREDFTSIKKLTPTEAYYYWKNRADSSEEIDEDDNEH